MNQKQTASVSPSDATNGSYEPEQGARRRRGHDARRRGGAGRERGVAEARADIGEGLVDERLEALARLDGEAAHGVGGVDRDAHDAGISSGRASRPSARRTARPSASSDSTTSRS